MATRKKVRKSYPRTMSYEQMWRQERDENVKLREELALHRSAAHHPPEDTFGPIHTAYANSSTPLAPHGQQVETLPGGGVQTKRRGRFDLIDGDAMQRLAEVFEDGLWHGEDNWRQITAKIHIGRMLAHAFKVLSLRGVPRGDMVLEQELDHMMCRAVMAVGVKG